MKTVGVNRAYMRGCLVGVVAGVPLAVAFSSLFGGANFGVVALRDRGSHFSSQAEADAVIGRTVTGAGLGFFLGILLGVAGAGLWVAASGKEARDQMHEPDPTVEDGGLGRTFPGVFGTADPFEPFKRRIDAEEAQEEAPASPPATMPEKCPACEKALDREEPVAFCYHCGAALT